jgi:lysyl endopeptidase
MRRISLFIAFMMPLLHWSQVEKGGTPFSWNNGNVLQGAIWHELSMPDVSALLEEDVQGFAEKALPYRFSSPITVQWNTGIHGRWTTLPNGDRIWRLGIRVPSASMLSCVFDDFDIPPGARLYFYNRAQTEFVGPYTRNAALGDEAVCSLPVNGGEMIVEYFEPFSQRGNGFLSIASVNAGYRQFNQAPSAIDDACFRLLTPNEMRSLREPSRSVVLMLVDNGCRTATGTLINPRQNAGSVFLITATSALIGDPKSYAFVLDYSPDQCVNQVSCWSKALYGATIVANDSVTGLSLLRLDQRPKNAWSAYFSGWSSGLNASSIYFSIQHSLGCSQSVGLSTESPATSTWSGFASRNFSSWSEGGMFPGSIGAPLFNDAGQLEGVYIGGNGTCSSAGEDGFGAFRMAWSSFSSYLHPGSTGFSGQMGSYPVFDEKVEEVTVAANYLYPNPAIGEAQLNQPDGDAITFIQFIDALGKVNHEVWNPGRSVSVVGLKPGVYQVRLATSKGEVLHQRLVVR